MPEDQAVAQVLHRAQAFLRPAAGATGHVTGAAQADDFGWAAGAPAGHMAPHVDRAKQSRRSGPFYGQSC